MYSEVNTLLTIDASVIYGRFRLRSQNQNGHFINLGPVEIDREFLMAAARRCGETLIGFACLHCDAFEFFEVAKEILDQ